MRTNKTLVSCAVAAALGLGSATTLAATVYSLQLGDYVGGGNTDTLTVGADGRISDFGFFNAPSGSSANKFGASGELCGGSPCAAIIMSGTSIGTNVFTTGFNFGGAAAFSPNITAGGMTADITGTTLTFSSLSFGGVFFGVQFHLAPNIFTNCAGQTGCGTSPTMGYEALAIATASNVYAVRIRYVSTINEPGTAFNGFQANLRLEAMTAVPTPAPALLLGSGLAGLVAAARRRKKSG